MKLVEIAIFPRMSNATTTLINPDHVVSITDISCQEVDGKQLYEYVWDNAKKENKYIQSDKTPMRTVVQTMIIMKGYSYESPWSVEQIKQAICASQ